MTTLKFVLLLIVVLTFVTVKASNYDDEMTYEPSDDICNKCNCTNVNGTLEDGESGTLFTLDCSMKDYERIFAKWPEEMGDNHTGIELIYILSLSKIQFLQQLPPTDATLFFTCRHCNIIKIASHAFINTPNIKLLDLSFNNIESLELFPEIFKGPYSDEQLAPIQLQTMDLSHNKISYLEKILFEHMPYLKSLDLSYNPIDIMNEQSQQALASLLHLEILDLSHTGIMELPGAILENKEKLTEIFLNGNKFLEIPESLSAVGESLEYLHLSDNPIEEIEETSLIGLSELKQLNISGLLQLTEIKKNSLKYLTSLEVFHCFGNVKLTNFDMEDLRELKHLKELDISNNALTTLNFGVILENEDAENLNETMQDIMGKYEDQFKMLRVLKLAGNPWTCDCDMMKSLSLFNHNASYFTKSVNNDDARCKTPYDLSSKLLYDLPMDYVCITYARQKSQKIPIYDPPQFLRPKSIMLTVFSVVGVVVLGIIIGFTIVCIKRRLKSNNDLSYSSSPIRYTTVRDSTISNIANAPYNPS
ncbi:CLUMA_CG001985, isoform A [Clunio marinus]|uniref:CLUMA_CG001985, isoform A n=1 Tax=Clunio marinus TaxID=568069 RepID=A0A1J1HLB3_9DIPT|nr:CLUMA_CG001985, isoform A [Clunio marinus]